VIERVDSRGGVDLSMALDENDCLHVAYYSYDDEHLHYATLSEAIRPVEPGPRPFPAAGIALVACAVAGLAALGIIWRRKFGSSR
jgi:hypothetical protein